MSRTRRLMIAGLLLLWAVPGRAEVTRVEIQRREDVLGGKAFGRTGPYEKLIGKVYFAVDPENPHNKIIADLDKAQTLAPKRADVLVYRASAWRLRNDLAKARADADAAVALDPKSAEALLERGNIRRLTDDPAGARVDWLQVVQLAAGTPAADAAKANLEKLDVKP